MLLEKRWERTLCSGLGSTVTSSLLAETRSSSPDPLLCAWLNSGWTTSAFLQAESSRMRWLGRERCWFPTRVTAGTGPCPRTGCRKRSTCTWLQTYEKLCGKRDTKHLSRRQEESPMRVLLKACWEIGRPTWWRLPDRRFAIRNGPGRQQKAGNRKSCGAFTATSAKKLTRPSKRCIVRSGERREGASLKFVHTADTH